MNTALTIGNFDGVHLGHKRLIHRVIEIARRERLIPALLTFDPHPMQIVAPAPRAPPAHHARAAPPPHSGGRH